VKRVDSEARRQIEVRRMWKGGPLRQISQKRPNAGWIAVDAGGYAGPYVCDKCQKPCQGVYKAEDGWQCGDCRKAVGVKVAA